MPDPILQEDLTGEAGLPWRRTGEEHLVNSTVGHVIALNYGSFFTESLVVRKKDSNETLLPGVDYIALHLNKEATIATGKEICTVINFINTDINEIIAFDYQAVGGQYSANVEAIRDLFLQLAADERPVTWQFWGKRSGVAQSRRVLCAAASNPAQAGVRCARVVWCMPPRGIFLRPCCAQPLCQLRNRELGDHSH